MARLSPKLLHPLLVLLLMSTASGDLYTPSVNISILCSSAPDLASLPADRLTVLISAYHPSRSALLSRLALTYASLPIVSSVVVLWSNPSSPPRPPHLPQPPPPPTALVLPSTSDSPLPSPLLRSRFVVIADDDVSPSAKILSLALSLASTRPRALIGFFPRSHAFDLQSRSWIYTVHRDRYSVILTKLMVLRADYLHKYSCRPDLAGARAVVDRERNCEDVLMNFVAAMETEEGPLLVGGRVRDYGDPRNRGGGGEKQGLRWG
ncbi:hypothetical protein HPP92_018330 [Vanilla planifolia]|uniref:Glycosyl transferase 64 domain-containing protein n=1 Tax=Vanilla planifolia TaxID=51239 RepID=A0A835UN94_VANPL|nr:hypothetical protein HPP92_018330 [Vanilla planifolia]